MNILKLLVSVLKTCAQKMNRFCGNVKSMLMNHPEIYWHRLMMAHDCTSSLSFTTIQTTRQWLITLRSVTDQPAAEPAIRRYLVVQEHMVTLGSMEPTLLHSELQLLWNRAPNITATFSPAAKTAVHCIRSGLFAPCLTRIALEPRTFQLLSL